MRTPIYALVLLSALSSSTLAKKVTKTTTLTVENTVTITHVSAASTSLETSHIKSVEVETSVAENTTTTVTSSSHAIPTTHSILYHNTTSAVITSSSKPVVIPSTTVAPGTTPSGSPTSPSEQPAQPTFTGAANAHVISYTFAGAMGVGAMVWGVLC